MRISDWSSVVCSSDLGAGGYTPFDACQVSASSVQSVRRPGLDGRRIGLRQHAGAAVLADIFGIVADEAVALAGHAVLALAGRGDLEALLNTALGLELGPFRLLVFREDLLNASAAPSVRAVLPSLPR